MTGKSKKLTPKKKRNTRSTTSASQEDDVEARKLTPKRRNTRSMMNATQEEDVEAIKLTPKRRNTRSTMSATEEEDMEARIDAEIDRFLEEEDNDCPAYAEADDEDEEEEVDVGVGVEEETCRDLSAHFGEAFEREDPISDADSGDDIWNDDKIPNPISSDEDEDRYEERERLANTLESEELLYLGKTFGCADDFKLALLRYSLKTRYDIKMYKSSAKRLGAKCSDLQSNCPWRIYCSYERRKHKMQVKVYVNEHCCERSGYSKLLKRSSIAMLFAERLRLNPKMTRQEMVDEVKREYNLIVTLDQCGKAKSKLYRERKAGHEMHFSRIWDYQAAVRKSNPFTTIEIETIPGPTPGSKQRFNRMYVCFTSQRESWIESCRPIIGIDGAFLKWDIKGHLLAAVGRDGDNRIVPIAWAVVEIENNPNWEWFMKHLKDDLGLGDGAKYTIISDKQKGLVNAVHKELPEAEHRMCSRHILANWKRDSKDPELERIFWRIAKSYTLGDYENSLQALRSYSAGSYDSLLKTNPHTWARAFFKIGSYCNDNLNNLSESFNKTIREARKKPLLDLLEDIRRQCMVRNAKRFLVADRLKTKFTTRAHLEIEMTKEKSKDCRRYIACGNLHEVDFHGTAYSVDMNQMTCGCVKWQLTGIPCIHAVCVIMAKKQRVGDFASDFYLATMFKKTYSRGIKPVEGMNLWPRTNRLPVLSPPYRNGTRGRPSNHDRHRASNETTSSKTKMSREKRIITCSNCYATGHNKTTCSNPAGEPLPRRPVGRPRLYDVGQPSEAASSQSHPQAPSASSQPHPHPQAQNAQSSQPRSASQPAQRMNHGA